MRYGLATVLGHYEFRRDSEWFVEWGGLQSAFAAQSRRGTISALMAPHSTISILMNLILRRQPSNEECTIGQLYNDAGTFICYTLEDVIREVPGEPVSAWKIPGETAIPVGNYQITITHSPKFGRQLPLLNYVKGFEGVRIHPGNRSSDTEGCILVGLGIQLGDKALHESRTAFKKVYDLIDEALFKGEDVFIDVRNP